MDYDANDPAFSLSSMELLTIGGFALYFSWMFVVFYWLFCEFPPDLPVSTRDLAQFFVFAAVPIGYAVVHVMGKNPRFNVFSRPVRIGETACAILLPLIALVMYGGFVIPLPVVCIANFIAGFSASWIKLSWLDVCSRLQMTRYGRVTGLSLFLGGLVFVLVSFSPHSMQPLFGIAFIVSSMVILMYATAHAERNDERAPLESIADTWRFTKEIEPSFVMFGIVFGMTFVYLFNSGAESVLLGLISTLVGSLAVAILSISDRQVSITIYQRVFVVIAVCSCVMVPFVPEQWRLALSCAVTATWAMFMAVNYGYIVKKCVIAWEAPLFRQAPLRLAVPALGFAGGWAIAAVLSYYYGVHSDAFLYLRLVIALMLVLTIMVFYPSKTHHPVDGSSPDEVRVQTTIVASDRSEAELFEQRCTSVAKLFQLSPRETEILGYLAKGRNAAYIQEALVISPHTVKSHIYNIYRKLDIHSQQKLMDFVEDFPLD